MKAIGGYPQLELSKGEHYHKEALRLNTARNCLEYILIARQYKKVYVPFYTCEAVLEPFNKLGSVSTTTEFYHINNRLDPVEVPQLKVGEAFLYTNYFGLKRDTVERLASLYGNQLIVDNSQAFFDYPLEGIDTFYSARKFFGVSDGAYLYTNAVLTGHSGTMFETDISFNRMDALLKRIDLGAEAGYVDFQATENELSMQPIKKMSKLTETILASIDYESVRRLRRNNYKTLFGQLSSINCFMLTLKEDAVPLCYPFFANNPEFRTKLIAKKIFVPAYWPNVLEYCAEDTIEYKLAKNILPIPLDQRYDDKDMNWIISCFKKLHNSLNDTNSR